MATVTTTRNAATGTGSTSDAGIIVRRLLVVTSVIHFRYQNQLWAYGPYVRELEIWADIFPELVIAAPCREGQPQGDSLPIRRENVSIHPIIESGGDNLWAKIKALFMLPFMVWQLTRAMRLADAIHVRCPGNLGLLGAIFAPLYSRRLVTKYAGQWTGYPGETWSFFCQRKVLSSAWWRGPVTVYGQWPNQPKHIIPFFSTAFTEEQLARARAAAKVKNIEVPLRVLFVGRLSIAKRVDTLLAALAELKRENLSVQCTIIGEGEEQQQLEQLAAALGIAEQVEFIGGIGFDEVLAHYERAHILVLASESEGFPKAILEGMAFGMVCIGSNRGFVPTMLGEGRGLTVTPGDVPALTSALRGIAHTPGDYQPMANLAAAWADRYSLGHMRESIRELLSEHWAVPIPRLYDSPDTEPGVASS